MKKIYSITNKIINVLSKLEDDIKSKWEQKKDVKKEHYIITIDKLQQWLNEKDFNDIIDDVLRNKKQVEEWKQLGFGEIKTKDDIYLTQLNQDKKTKNKKKKQNGNLFEENDTIHQEQNAGNNNPIKKLPIDTRHFDETFQENLLQKISEKIDIEEELNGLLIKSENWQALNNLLDKYREKIKCIYIDPPYNTGNDGFLYKDGYQHSTWLTMMENRLQIARELMYDDGVIFVSIDDNEVTQLRTLMNEIFWEENFVAQIIRLTGSTRNMAVDIDIRHDYLLLYAKNRREIDINGLTRGIDGFINPDNDPEGNWSTQDLTVRTGGYEYEIPSIDGTKIFKNRWRYNIDKMKVVMGGSKDDEFLEIYRKNAVKVNVKGKEWFIVGKIVFKGSKNVPNYKKYLKDVPDITVHTIWDDIESQKFANENLIKISDGKKVFDNPKPVGLIKKTLNISTNSNSVILDFFAGSGTTAHAVMKLNAEDGGKRKFILVEMAEYFDTIIIPRIKKVAYSFDWKEGIPKNNNGIGCFIKYLYLQNFEEII
jgi:adenine-specific DNA-methyltransferase